MKNKKNSLLLCVLSLLCLINKSSAADKSAFPSEEDFDAMVAQEELAGAAADSVVRIQAVVPPLTLTGPEEAFEEESEVAGAVGGFSDQDAFDYVMVPSPSVSPFVENGDEHEGLLFRSLPVPVTGDAGAGAAAAAAPVDEEDHEEGDLNWAFARPPARLPLTARAAVEAGRLSPASPVARRPRPGAKVAQDRPRSAAFEAFRAPSPVRAAAAGSAGAATQQVDVFGGAAMASGDFQARVLGVLQGSIAGIKGNVNSYDGFLKNGYQFFNVLHKIYNNPKMIMQRVDFELAENKPALEDILEEMNTLQHNAWVAFFGESIKRILEESNTGLTPDELRRRKQTIAKRLKETLFSKKANDLYDKFVLKREGFYRIFDPEGYAQRERVTKSHQKSRDEAVEFLEEIIREGMSTTPAGRKELSKDLVEKGFL